MISCKNALLDSLSFTNLAQLAEIRADNLSTKVTFRLKLDFQPPSDTS